MLVKFVTASVDWQLREDLRGYVINRKTHFKFEGAITYETINKSRNKCPLG
jgi:hypothetical protein